jgi:hypothetical protein
MADTTREALRQHMAQWQSEGQPGFNCNPIDALREEVRWLCERLDEPITILLGPAPSQVAADRPYRVVSYD